MDNMPEVRLGIIAGSTDWMPEDLAVEKRRQIVSRYLQLYGVDSVYECNVFINDNEVNIRRAMRELAKAGCNAICMLWGNYGPESAGTVLAYEFDGPVMICGAAEESGSNLQRGRTDALSGFINVCYALNLKKTSVYIPAHPIGTVDQCVEMMHDFVPVARTLIAIKDLKIISIGPRPASYLAAYAPNHLLYDIGVEVDEYSELELFDSFNKHIGDQRTNDIVLDMQKELNEGTENKFLSKFAQYEITINDWVRSHKGNRKYVTLTSTCWPAFPVNFGFVPCYVNSRLTGRGIPVACEVDVYGALSEYIGQCVSDDSVALLNINNNIPADIFEEQVEGREFNGKKYEISDLFLAYHCGVTSSQRLNECSLKSHFVNSQLIGEEQSQGTIQGEIESGPVTIFRIQGSTDGFLHAYVAQGQMLPMTMDTYGGRGVIAIPEFGRFCRNVVIGRQFPNHTVVLFGHYGKIIMDVLNQLGIKDIEYNHPKDILYRNENWFENNGNWF